MEPSGHKRTKTPTGDNELQNINAGIKKPNTVRYDKFNVLHNKNYYIGVHNI